MNNIFDDLERLAGRNDFEVETEAHETEDRYLMMMGLEFETAEELMNFYNENLKEHTTRPALVYGNSRDVESSAFERDSWASFRPQKESVREGEWAVDVPRTIDRHLNLGEAESNYEETAKTLAAATLYTISRAESDGEVGTGMYDFHKNLINLPGEEPVEIEVTRKEPARYGEILSGNVDEVREKVQDIEDPDYNRLIEEEERRDNRVTLKRYFRDQQEIESEDI